MSDTFTSQAQASSVDPFAAAPGKQTSEYAATVIAQFVSTLVAMVALFSPGFTIDSTTQAVIVSFAGSTIAVSQMVYAWNRSRVKIAAAQAAGNVQTQPNVIVEKAESVINAQAANGVGPLQPGAGAE